MIESGRVEARKRDSYNEDDGGSITDLKAG
jgi:hypothetical protein